ncbi:MAG: hypothetical protein OEY59_12425, partial [Deltaproteobacteria bacterium]|nr:hypothetical protein [Deltaproteobacteria bacterium]
YDAHQNHEPEAAMVPAAPKIQPAVTLNPILANGLSSQFYQNNRKLSEVTAESLVVQPRKFALFNIRNVNELKIENVLLNDYFYPGEDYRFQSSLNGLAQEIAEIKQNPKNKEKDIFLNGVGYISMTVINRFHWNIFFQGAKKIELVARKVVFKGRDVQFFDAQIRLIKRNRTIESKMVKLDLKRKLFLIPDYQGIRNYRISLISNIL